MKVVLHAESFIKLDKELKYLDTHSVRIGFINETEKNEDGEIILDYAKKNEYGDPEMNVPSRPFFRTTFIKHAKDIENRMKQNFTKVINSTMTGQQALNNIGILVQGYIRNNIRNGNWKPNAKLTKKLKGNKPPLIDSSSMLKAVNYEIIRR